ncbi:MAG: hypothetical protein ACI8SE_000790 [Bacteroidia bacterium]|jgi:hypothetical protein
MRATIILWTCIFAVALGCQTPHKPVEEVKTQKPFIEQNLIDAERYAAAKLFVTKNIFNSNIAFFTDMHLRSGRKRFFVVDLAKDSVIVAGLVTHGHCQNYGSRKPQFSNEVGSNCTSLGKYKIGYKYPGNYGTAYKLHGLEESNSNAFDRFVVLHAHDCVTNTESVVGICRSEGCPTVSPDFLTTLVEYIDASDKPILLWVYNN